MWWRICLPLMVFDRMIFMCNVVENWLVRSIIAAVVLVGVFTINLPFFILLLVLLDHHLHHSPPMDTAILIFFVCVCIFAYICNCGLWLLFVCKASQQDCYHNDGGSDVLMLNAIVLGFWRIELWRFTFTKRGYSTISWYA